MSPKHRKLTAHPHDSRDSLAADSPARLLPQPKPSPSFFHAWGELEEKGVRLSQQDRYWAGILGGDSAWSPEKAESTYGDVVSKMRQLLGSLKGKRVLELGCGDGTLLRYLKEVCGMEVRGLDSSHLAVEHAKLNNNLAKEVSAGGPNALDALPSAWADVVLSVRLMEPLSLTQHVAEDFLRKSAHVLREGGLQLHFVTEDAHKAAFRRVGYEDFTEAAGGLFKYCMRAQKK